MERIDISGGDDSWTIVRRDSVCGVSWALGGVCVRHADCGGGTALHVPHKDAATGAATGADDGEDYPGGIALYLAREADSGSDLAGPVCSVTGWSGGAASRVCARDSSHRAVGIRTVAYGSRGGRGGDGRGAGASSAARACWTDA